MREQRMLVSGLYKPGHRLPGVKSQVPLVLLSGVWLGEAGFRVGCEVRVKVERGRLVIEPAAGASRRRRDV
jgi:hypothetical protein